MIIFQVLQPLQLYSDIIEEEETTKEQTGWKISIHRHLMNQIVIPVCTIINQYLKV